MAFYLGALITLAFNLQPPLRQNTNTSNKTPTVNIQLYAGEISGSKYGFGTSPNNLTSPGLTLRFKITDIINVTVTNVGKMPHAFAVTNTPKTGAAVLFKAEIASPTNPLQPGQHGTIIFTPDNAGNFYYICPVPGHAETGMYGSVIVTG